MQDDLGTRLKGYEAVSTGGKAFKGQPLVARLDGRGFHTFCKGLKKPFDDRLSRLMIRCMRSLVDRFGANVGYTQSDEISLAWFADSTSTTEYVFDGRFQKLNSLLAAYCTAVFNRDLQTFLPEKGAELPIFDCRSFVVPNLLEAYHSILWRQQDATKNAISMAAQSMFSHKSLQGLKGWQMQEKMWAEKGVNFNTYPAHFRRGTFARRVKVVKPLDPATIAKLEALGRPLPNQVTGVERSEIQTSNAWLQRLDDPVSYLFKDGQEVYRTATGKLLDSEQMFLQELSESAQAAP
jgi:tRNA(His) 5'-end guanylyltransferase